MVYKLHVASPRRWNPFSLSPSPSLSLSNDHKGDDLGKRMCMGFYRETECLTSFKLVDVWLIIIPISVS